MLDSKPAPVMIVAHMTTANAKVLKTSREAVEIAVIPQIVWHTLTEPREIANWLGPDARIERYPNGTANIASRCGPGFVGRVVEVDSTRLWIARGDGAEPDSLEFQLGQLPHGTMIRAVRSRMFARDEADERIAAEEREWRFALLSLRQYVERNRRTSPLVVDLTADTPLAPQAAWELLVGSTGWGAHGSIAKVQRRDRFTFGGPSGGAIAGRAVFHDPRGQFVAEAEGLGDALLQLAVLRTERGTVVRATVRAFGVEPLQMTELEARWRDDLARLFA